KDGGWVVGTLIGATASQADYPLANFISSHDDVGHTYTGTVGMVGEAKATATDTGTGTGGVGMTNGANQGRGVTGVGKVSATGDNGAAIGVYGRAEDTHSGGRNIGLYGYAVNAATNYALWMANGNINSAVAQNWELLDNNANALSFDSTGKADILKIDTTDGAEKVIMSGGLEVTGLITGNASTATALATNGTNCSAGQAALGVDASGAAEGCWTPSASLPSAAEGQILQADADGVFQPVSEIAGLINDAGTATDDLWSASKITSMLGGKQDTLGVNAYQAYDANMITWPSTISATEVGYLNGLSEALSTSLAAKAPTTSAALTTPAITGASYPATASASTATGDINIDGVSADHYYFNNGADAATYTPVITSAPATGYERGIILTVGGGAGVITMTWTNVSFIGTAGEATTTASKYSHYACFIPSSGNAKCKIIAEASDN
ncbi:MAG: hypothetical protein RBR35_17245, partial [Salinivirgaceae bacterium]|nr:hypothetical protein [Salinivirgaceae bacterium]